MTIKDILFKKNLFYHHNNDPESSVDLFVLIAPLVMVLFMCDMWIRNNYAISAVLVLITVV